MNDLEALVKKYRELRGDRKYYRHPKYIWEEIEELAKYHSLSTLAKALGISHQHLRKKLSAIKISKKPGELTFAPLAVKASSFTSSIEFKGHNSCAMTVHFQADMNQLIHMIQTLAGNEQ